MSKWVKPEINELNISNTEHDWTGMHWDGGYIGDGVVSGHLTWDRPKQDDEKPAPTPEPASDPSIDDISSAC